MVQLRVDVEAANARRAFEQAARAVDDLGDQLTDAQIDALRLEDAMDDTAREAARLRAEVHRLGSAAPQSLRNALRDAEDAAEAARLAFARADGEVDRLARSLDDAEDEADRLRRTLDRLDADANRGFRGMQRGLLGFQQTLSDTISGGFRGLPAEAKAAIIAAVGAGALALASVAGAAINAAILGAVGGGALAAGIALAVRNSDIVQAAFGDLGKEIEHEVSGYASIFEKPLVRSAEIFGATWDRIGPGVGRIFASLVGTVEPLALGLSRMAERAMPGLEKAAEAAGPVLEQLAEDLPELGEAAADMFEAFSDGEGAVKGVRAIVMALAAAMRLLGVTVEFLSNNWDRITESMSRFMHRAADIPGIGKLFEPFERVWANLNNEVGGSIKAMDGAVIASDGTTAAMARQAEVTRKAAQAAQDLSNKLHGLISNQLSADQAALAWETTLDQLTESLRQNGATLDMTNSKGQQNVGIVLQMIEIAERMRQAAIDLAGGEKASAEAVAAANATYFAQIAALRSVLRQAGLTEAQIDALLAKYQQMANAPDISKRISVYHTTYYREVGGPNYRRVPGAQVAYASGTSYARAGYALVGEEGPELVRFRGGEQVSTAAETARILAGRSRPAPASSGAGGGSTWIAAPTNANRGLIRALEKAQRREVRGRARGSSQRYLAGTAPL